MSLSTKGRIGCAVLIAAALFAIPVRAQEPDAQKVADTITRRWPVILREVAAGHGATVEGNVVRGSNEIKTIVYQEAIDRIQRDPDLLAMVYPDPNAPEYDRLVREKVREQDIQLIAQLKQAGTAGTSAKSVNSRSTNPAAGKLTERSGFAELLALALDNSNVISANETAVSLNVSGLALVSLADPDVYSELYRYQQHAVARRFGGTVVFGAKVPEKEITGLSGLPDFEKLLDVMVWDVKMRLWGNRDVRDKRWYPLTLGRAGMDGEIAATLLSLLGPREFPIAQPLLSPLTNPARIKRTIQRSPQLSFKASGTHLTKESGKNKYAFGLLFDAGIGAADLTTNLLYSIVDDVRLGADNPFSVKQVTLNGQLTGKLAEGALVPGSAIEWSSGVVAAVFSNKRRLPFEVKNTWKVFTTFDVPLSAAARIPFSVVYTNDANALEKTKYVSGHVGISYDFSALTKLFGGAK